MKCLQLILRKMIATVATRLKILRLECTKFDFGWDCPRARWGSLQRATGPVAGFEKPNSEKREGNGRGKERGGK